MTLHMLPNEAIEVGRREEVFYSVLSKEKRAALPSEGKWVRQLVSEEMLRQFGIPMDQELIVTERGMVKAEVSKFVDRFYSKSADPKR